MWMTPLESYGANGDSPRLAIDAAPRVCGELLLVARLNQFAHTQEAPKSICGTEGGRTKGRGGKISTFGRALTAR